MGTVLLNYSTQRRRGRRGMRAAADQRRLNWISGQAVDGAVHVHGFLGPGLLESAYENCLVHELRERGLVVRTQVLVPITYKGLRLEQGYRIDVLVEESVVVEIKTVQKLHPIHEAQMLTYLRLSGHSVGLLLNFSVPRMRDGIKHIVNRL